MSGAASDTWWVRGNNDDCAPFLLDPPRVVLVQRVMSGHMTYYHAIAMCCAVL